MGEQIISNLLTSDSLEKQIHIETIHIAIQITA